MKENKGVGAFHGRKPVETHQTTLKKDKDKGWEVAPQTLVFERKVENEARYNVDNELINRISLGIIIFFK